MPRKLRKPKIRREIRPLTDPEIEVLLYGSYDPQDAKGGARPGTWRAFSLLTPGRFSRFVEAWQDHRDALLGAWIAERPGSRPFGWWRCDSPELRRRHVAGSGRANDDATGAAGAAWYYCVDPDDPPILESEPEFLRRHNLLTPVEVRVLKPDAYAPVPAPRYVEAPPRHERFDTRA